MFVAQTILPGQVGLLELTYDGTAIDQCTISEDTFIESDDLKLIFSNEMTDKAGVQF